MARLSSSIVLALLAAAPVLAGCLAPGPAADVETAASSLPMDWYARALARDEEHNHTEILHHQNGSTPNFRVLGHDPLFTEAYDGAPAFPYGCGDVATRPDDGRRIVLANGFMDEMVFALVDVTDPASPTKIGEFYQKGMVSWDAAMTPDAKYALVAFTGQPYGVPKPTLHFRTACAIGEIALPVDALHGDVGSDAGPINGLVAIDISDPAHPVFADWDPAPGRNMHSVSSAVIDGETWIIGSVLGGPTTLGLAPPGTVPTLPASVQHPLSYVIFDRMIDTPLGPKLERVSTFQMPVTIPTEGPPVVPLRNGHIDVILQKHPIDGKVYAYIANWEGGAITVDFSNPRVPVVAGMWMPPHDAMPKPAGDGPCYLTTIHGVMPAPEAWEGKHYYFAGQECPFKVDLTQPGGSIFIVDNTDPTNPTLVGSWHPPEETGVWTVEYQVGPHYTAISGRTLYVSMYHAGVWAVDVSDPATFAAPPAIGVFLPDRPHLGVLEKPETAPNVEQVDTFPDGLVIVIENGSGVYTLDFDETDPAPPALPYPYV